MFYAASGSAKYEIQSSHIQENAFPRCLCFQLIKIVQKNFMIFNKMRSAVYKLWSSTHQLKKISIFVTTLFFLLCISDIINLQIYMINSLFCILLTPLKSIHRINTCFLSSYFHLPWYILTKFSNSWSLLQKKALRLE